MSDTGAGGHGAGEDKLMHNAINAIRAILTGDSLKVFLPLIIIGSFICGMIAGILIEDIRRGKR